MNEKQTPKPKGKKSTKLIIPVLILLVITGAIAIFIKNMNGPAEGEISQVQPTSVNIKPGLGSSGKYDGRYISFTYPANYQTTPAQKSGGFLEVVALNNTNHSGKYISVGVVKESLQNDSGVNYRIGHPELYKKIVSTPDSVAFKGTSQSAEQTGFIAHNGLVTSISLTAIGTKDLNTDYETIARSLKWKN
jgi:hypothetical protein